MSLRRASQLAGPVAVPLAIAAGLAVLYLIWSPPSPDHAAQYVRTTLFETSGPVTWSNWWFGGHHLPAYSLLSPPLGALLGYQVMGAIATVVTALLFAAIANRRWGRRAIAGSILFAVLAATNLYAGRLTFALGVMLALAAVFAAQRNWRLTSLVLAAGTGPASPVAALFLACCGFSHYLVYRPDRRGLELAVVAFGVAGLVALFFPGHGAMPYATSSFATAFLLTLAAAALVPAKERLVRTGLLVYAASILATYLISTPMGGNVNRLGLLIAPLLIITGLGSGNRLRTGLVILVAALVSWWQLDPAIRDVRKVLDDPSVEVSFDRPLVKALKGRLEAQPSRVEVVPASSHWETARLVQQLPLARGWERQTDRGLNPVFYDGTLNARTYRRWLDQMAVGWVALPNAEIDYGGVPEAALIKGGLPYLKETPVGGDWRLFRVKNPTPLVPRPARMVALDTDGFTVSSAVAGSYLVRVRTNPYWRVEGGLGCVGPGRDGWTLVRFDQPGALRIGADFRPGARFGSDENCRPR